MKVYVDENDIKRKIVIYHDGTNTQQGLYVYGKDKIEVLSLSDYTKQVRKEVYDEIRKKADIKYYEEYDGFDRKIGKTYIIRDYDLNQIQGE